MRRGGIHPSRGQYGRARLHGRVKTLPYKPPLHVALQGGVLTAPRGVEDAAPYNISIPYL